MTGCRLIEESVVLTFSTYAWGKHFFGFVFLFILSFKRKDICGKICMLLYKRKTDQYCLKWGKCYCSFFSLFVASIADQNKLDWGFFFQSGIDQFPKNINKSETVNHKCVFYGLYGIWEKYKCGFGFLYSFSDKVIRVCYFFLFCFFQLFIIGQKDKTFKLNTNTNKTCSCLLQIP